MSAGLHPSGPVGGVAAEVFGGDLAAGEGVAVDAEMAAFEFEVDALPARPLHKPSAPVEENPKSRCFASLRMTRCMRP